MAEALDDLTKIRFDLLKTEMTLLAGKAKDTVDNLWRIRTYAYTFWIACVGAGLAGLARTGPGHATSIIWPPVWLSFLPPLVAAYVDATYHAWYRLIMLRESEIEKFLNEESYSSPSTRSTSAGVGGPVARSDLSTRLFAFPVYDLGAFYTFGDASKRKWEGALIRSLTSGTPLLVYGSQLIGSAVIIFSFSDSSNLLRYSGGAIVLLAFTVLLTATWMKRRELFHRRNRANTPLS